MAEQHVLCGGLFGEHVKGNASDMAAIESSAQCRFVYQPAASTIDDAHPLLHCGECLPINNILGLISKRRMQGDKIGAVNELLEGDPFDTNVLRVLRRKEGIVSDHLH